jgi:cell division protein FtsL
MSAGVAPQPQYEEVPNTARARAAAAGAAAPKAPRTGARQAPTRKAGAATAPRATRTTAHRSGAGVRRGVAPRAPRRVSGPARPPRGAVAASGAAVALPQPLVPRAAEALRRLPDAKWLDKLVRGQGWIVLIGIALIGIVAMQVHLLKLNAGIGRAVEHTATLERQNADLRAEVSRMSAPERIQQVAERFGLVMPNAGDVRYVGARGARDAQRAAKVMRAPNPQDSAAALTGAAAGAETAGTTTDPTAAAPTADPTTATPGTTAPAQPTDPAAAGTAPAPTTGTAPTAQTAPSAGTAPAPTPAAAPDSATATGASRGAAG